jgi:hypothetical protein
MRTYSTRHAIKGEQHAEYMNLMELREVARDILLRRSTTERRACPEWLNCWVYGSEMLQRQHPGKPKAYPRTKQTLIEYGAWIATLPPQDLLPACGRTGTAWIGTRRLLPRDYKMAERHPEHHVFVRAPAKSLSRWLVPCPLAASPELPVYVTSV